MQRPSWVLVVGPLVLVLGTLLPRSASAYPWLIKHGYGGCATCHADPSGGELLTTYGSAQGDLLVRMRYGKSGGASTPAEAAGDDFDDFGDDEFEDLDAPKPQQAQPEPRAAPEESGPSSTAGFLWGLAPLPDALLLGGSLRQLSIYRPSESDFRSFPMQADIYGQLTLGFFRAGGSLGVARVPPGSPHARAAQVTTGQGEDFNLLSRSHWVGADIGSRKQYLVRAGRLNLPFGVRIPEHVLWAREATQTDRESDQQHGLALAYSGSWLRAEVMAIAGNYQINPDAFRERGYSLYAEALVSDSLAVGVSSLITHAEQDRLTLQEGGVTRQAHGATVRGTLTSDLVLLGEADALFRTGHGLGYVGLAQLDYEPIQGLHLMGTFEVLDFGKLESLPAAPGVGEPRLGGWLSVNWFFLPHLDMRVDAVARQEDPFTLMAGLHAYL